MLWAKVNMLLIQEQIQRLEKLLNFRFNHKAQVYCDLHFDYYGVYFPRETE